MSIVGLDRESVEQILVARDDALWFRTSSGVFRYAVDTGAPRIEPSGEFPQKMNEALAVFEFKASDYWGMSEPLAVQYSLNSKEFPEQAANRPIV